MKREDVRKGVKARVLRNLCAAEKPDSEGRIEAGDIIILTGDFQLRKVSGNNCPTYFKPGDSNQYIELEDIEMIREEENFCKCPPENFRFNGLGCVCGGN